MTEDVPHHSPADRSIPPAGALVLEVGALDRPLDLDALFGRQAPVELEIGIGSGFFLSRYALERPDLNLLGLDHMGSEVYRTADKCVRLGLAHVQVVRCDAVYFLETFVRTGSVAACHVYYSDPWPKRRHHKRRLWRPAFVAQVARVLAPGGSLLLKTDVTEYFEVIDAVVRGHGGLELAEDRRLDLDPMPGDIESNFQGKAVAAGHPLHYQRWVRRAEG